MAVIRQREVEFKLIAPSARALRCVPAVLRSLGFRLGPARRQRVRDIYLDTPDFRCCRAGLACRLRVADNAAEIGFKALAPAAGGLASREECAEKLRCVPPFPVRRFPGTALAKQMGSPAHGAAVRVLFELRQQRVTWRARLPDGLELAVSADAVRFPGSRARVYELELELLRGKARELRKIGDRLGRRLNFVPDKISKFERGLKRCRVKIPSAALRRHRGAAAGRAAALPG